MKYRDTGARRCELIGGDLFHQLLMDLQNCDWFSLALDESTDVTDVSQMLVSVCFVTNFEITVDILALILLSDID